MNNCNYCSYSNTIINEQNLIPISELPFQYNISTISTIEAKEEKEKKVKMVKNRQAVEKNNQYSIEQWFSPNSKKKNQELKASTEDNSNSLITFIDLTENSSSEVSDIELNEELKEEIIILNDDKKNLNDNKKLSLRKSITPKKISKNTPTKNSKLLIKSPYFSRKKEVVNEKPKQESKIIDKKKVINLIDSSGEENDSEDTIQDNEQDIKQISMQDNDSFSEQDNETMNKTDNEEDGLKESEKYIEDEKNASPTFETKEYNTRKRSLRSRTKSLVNSSDSKKLNNKNNKKKSTINEAISVDDDDDIIDESDNDNSDINKSIIEKNPKEMISINLEDSNSQVGSDSSNKENNDRSNRIEKSLKCTKNDSNNESIAKIKLKEINNIVIDNTSEEEKDEINSDSSLTVNEVNSKIESPKDDDNTDFIKKDINFKSNVVIYLNSNSNSRASSVVSENEENTLDDNSVNDMNEDKQNKEETERTENNKTNKKRRRQSISDDNDRKKIKIESESQDINEVDKKITYKQSSLTGFSKSAVQSYKPRKKASIPKEKKIIPIPTFESLSNHSVLNRYNNLVIPDIIKLLSVSDFLEKFGDCILDMDQKINFYTLYQNIIYPTANSFKLLSNIYVALLKYLNKDNICNLIIPINELTWQSHLIPTITETLRIHYGIKRTSMYNYSLPDHLNEIQTHEFYHISPLAHVKTLQQLISIIADTHQFRDQIERLLDQMVQLGLQRRYENLEKKMMEEEVNNMHRDVNIVGIRIKTLELELKKEKEANSKPTTNNKSRSKRSKNTSNQESTIDHRALSRLHAEYNKKVSALDKLKRSLKKKEDLILSKKKDKLNIKNKILKGNERFLGIDRFNRYYWLIDIKYISPSHNSSDIDSDDESKKEKEAKKSQSILSFITKDDKGKLALSNSNTTLDENIYGIVIEDCRRKMDVENYYNVYYYYDDDILYDYTYEFISSISEVKSLLNSLQLDDYDEELLHTNIIDLFSSRGYTIDSQKKLGNTSSTINVETSLKNFKEWCENLGNTLISVTENDINILNEKNTVMYLNKINEVTFALEKDFELPPITIILDDMANNDVENDNTINNILYYHKHHIGDIVNKIKEIYTNHSDSIPHENVKKNTKHQNNKSLELTILNNNDVKLIIKKDKKEYVKFSDYQLEKINDVNNLSDLYGWFYEIKKILDVKSEKVNGKKPSTRAIQGGVHNLRERKKTNYTEIYYYSDDDDFM